MAIRLQFFDSNGRELSVHEAEDKRWWLARGEGLEQQSLDLCRTKGVLRGLIPNPARADSTAFLPEFIWQGSPLDVKAQRQPFFESYHRFGVPPRYAITINLQDATDVRLKYPACRLAIWVNWTATRYLRIDDGNRILADIRIEQLNGIWLLDPEGLELLAGEAQRQGMTHEYARRTTDRRENARSSYVVDVRRLTMIWRDRNLPRYEPIADGKMMLPHAK